MTDTRVFQAKILHAKGLGGDISFGAYLAAIPQIPTTLITYDPEFSFLRLVDPRLGLVKTCELFGIKFKEYGYSNKDIIPYDARHEIPNKPFWVRVHDGRKNRQPSVRLDEFITMTAMVAIMFWVQDPTILKQGNALLNCFGSIDDLFGINVFLLAHNGEVGLCVCRDRKSHNAYVGFRRG